VTRPPAGRHAVHNSDIISAKDCNRLYDSAVTDRLHGQSTVDPR
jgi:hypothetical protein